MSHTNNSPEREAESLVEDDVQVPRLFRVLLHNDNYTTMDFVVEVLMEIFHKSRTEATEIMLTVHERGMASCGLFPREIAEFQVHRVTVKSRRQGFPLLCTMEEE